MLQKNNDHIIDSKDTKPKEVVSIPVPLFESIEGNYFVSQTDILCVKKRMNAWAALVNPYDSGINLYKIVKILLNILNRI